MTIFRDVEASGLLLTLRNDIAANSDLNGESNGDWALWFKYGTMAALLHVDTGIARGCEPHDVLADLRDNILRLEQDRTVGPDAEVDIWPLSPQMKPD